MDKTKIATAGFNKCAAIYQDKFMDVSLYHDSFDRFCNEIPIDAEILELACGPGNITSYLLEKHPNYKIHGIDLAENMIELAGANNSKAQFEVMDCRHIAEINRKFDAIMCGFCLPIYRKRKL